MTSLFEDLRVLHLAEDLADAIWKDVIRWNAFARDTFGGQMVRAADSVGANIAESYGRFHFGEKLQFLYYARGSIFETKYWLNRAASRSIINTEQVQAYASQLTSLARQLNAFASHVRRQRVNTNTSSSVHEPSPTYDVFHDDADSVLFMVEELLWLENFHDSFPKPAITNNQ